jgi:hypothetical protein
MGKTVESEDIAMGWLNGRSLLTKSAEQLHIFPAFWSPFLPSAARHDVRQGPLRTP